MCMCVYIYSTLYACMCVYMCIYILHIICMHVCVCMCVYIYSTLYACIYVCVYIYILQIICMYLCVCICVYLTLYVCVYIYISHLLHFISQWTFSLTLCPGYGKWCFHEYWTYPSELECLSCPCMWPGVGLQDHMVAPLVFLKEPPYHPPWCLHHLHSHQKVGGLLFLHILSNVYLLTMAILRQKRFKGLQPWRKGNE